MLDNTELYDYKITNDIRPIACIELSDKNFNALIDCGASFTLWLDSFNYITFRR